MNQTNIKHHVSHLYIILAAELSILGAEEEHPDPRPISSDLWKKELFSAFGVPSREIRVGHSWVLATEANIVILLFYKCSVYMCTCYQSVGIRWNLSK